MGRHYCNISRKAVASKLLKQFICCDITKFERSKIDDLRTSYLSKLNSVYHLFRLFTLVPSYPENINIGNFAGLNIHHFGVLRKQRLKGCSCLELWERPKMLGKGFPFFNCTIQHFVSNVLTLGCRIACYLMWLRCHLMK